MNNTKKALEEETVNEKNILDMLAYEAIANRNVEAAKVYLNAINQ